MVGRERLTQMYLDFQAARFRLQMAEQTLKGAEREATSTEARFQGALEMLGGPNASWSYDSEKGISVEEATATEVAPIVPAIPRPNGHEVHAAEVIRTQDAQGNTTVVKLPTNRAKRKRVLRQMAKMPGAGK